MSQQHRPTRPGRLTALFSLALGLALLVPAAAAHAQTRPTPGEFGPLPLLDGTKSPLEIRVVNYTGGTNGEMVVDVRNPGKSKQSFQANGLYFVPGGDPEKAPQRLGAAGPFQAENDKDHSFTAAEKIDLAPGAVRRLKLQVYCIDSHRSSPTADVVFSLGKQRLPKPLRQEIDGKARALNPYKGAPAAAAPAAKSSIQSEVWAARNKKWIALDGERAAEKAAPSAPMRHPKRYRAPSPEQREVPVY
jgi:hypothetical protein